MLQICSTQLGICFERTVSFAISEWVVPFRAKVHLNLLLLGRLPIRDMTLFTSLKVA